MSEMSPLPDLSKIFIKGQPVQQQEKYYKGDVSITRSDVQNLNGSLSKHLCNLVRCVIPAFLCVGRSAGCQWEIH